MIDNDHHRAYSRASVCVIYGDRRVYRNKKKKTITRCAPVFERRGLLDLHRCKNEDGGEGCVCGCGFLREWKEETKPTGIEQRNIVARSHCDVTCFSLEWPG